jgi:hypothetical protein
MSSKVDLSGFYGPLGSISMIKFDECWHMDLIGILPSVVALRVALPFDQILYGFASSPFAM